MTVDSIAVHGTRILTCRTVFLQYLEYSTSTGLYSVCIDAYTTCACAPGLLQCTGNRQYLAQVLVLVLQFNNSLRSHTAAEVRTNNEHLTLNRENKGRHKHQHQRQYSSRYETSLRSLLQRCFLQRLSQLGCKADRSCALPMLARNCAWKARALLLLLPIYCPTIRIGHYDGRQLEFCCMGPTFISDSPNWISSLDLLLLLLPQHRFELSPKRQRRRNSSCFLHIWQPFSVSWAFWRDVTIFLKRLEREFLKHFYLAAYIGQYPMGSISHWFRQHSEFHTQQRLPDFGIRISAGRMPNEERYEPTGVSSLDKITVFRRSTHVHMTQRTCWVVHSRYASVGCYPKFCVDCMTISRNWTDLPCHG